MEIAYITPSGVALDEYGHELRDAEGCIIIVPVDERTFYETMCVYED